VTEHQTPDEVLEAEVGGRFHRALLLVELKNAADEVYEEFRHDDKAEGDLANLLGLCKGIREIEVRL
jgi:hypothetical protein